MGSKYHITEDGPKRCRAKTPESCRVNPSSESHYDDLDEAIRNYENSMETRGSSRLKSFSKVEKVDNASVIPMKGGSYYGLEVSEDSLRNCLDRWRFEMGDRSQSLEGEKVKRDGGYHFHITALDPKETRSLKKSGEILRFREGISKRKFSFEIDGVGSVSRNGKETYYAIVKSHDIQEVRKEFGLGEKDLHITLGFSGGDVHGVPKGESTRIF